jgi:predicted nuclease of predicted toxin-antitoxin system
MKLLLDQGLARSAATMLRNSGIDAVHIAEIGSITSTDEEILQIAREQGRVVATVDADFHAMLALSGKRSPSVIRIRIEGVRAQWLASLLQLITEQCAEALEHGAVITVTTGKLRVRRLPIEL